MSYRVVMTFCIANRNTKSFNTVKELANVIMDAWDNNKNLPRGKSTKKKFNNFLCDESMAAFVELTYFYDFMVSQDEPTVRTISLRIKVPEIIVLSSYDASIPADTKSSESHSPPGLALQAATTLKEP